MWQLTSFPTTITVPGQSIDMLHIHLDAGLQQKLVPSSGLVKGVYYYLVRHTEGTQQGGKLVVGV